MLTASEEAITERVRARGDVEMIDRALFLKKELEEMPENQDHIYDNSQKTLAEEISEISSNIESYLIK